MLDMCRARQYCPSSPLPLHGVTVKGAHVVTDFERSVGRAAVLRDMDALLFARHSGHHIWDQCRVKKLQVR